MRSTSFFRWLEEALLAGWCRRGCSIKNRSVVVVVGLCVLLLLCCRCRRRCCALCCAFCVVLHAGVCAVYCVLSVFVTLEGRIVRASVHPKMCWLPLCCVRLYLLLCLASGTRGLRFPRQSHCVCGWQCRWWRRTHCWLTYAVDCQVCM